VTLRPQPYALQFAGGLETKQDAKQVPPVRLLDLQNATFIKQTTLAKRNGYRALLSTVEGTLASVTSPVGLATRDSELIEFANGHAYSQIETGRWSDTGGVSSVVASSQPIARTGTSQSLPETATNGGITVAAWEDSRGGVWVSTIDANGREILAATQLAASGTRPRCVPVGNNIAVLYVVAASGQIWCAIVNPVSPGTVLTAQLLVEDLDPSNPSYDAEPTLYGYSTDKPAILAWATALGVRVGYVHPSGVIGGPLNGLPSVGTFTSALATGPIAVCWYLANPTPAAPVACIVWATAANVKFWFVNGLNLADISKQFGTAATQTGIQRITAGFDSSGTVWVASEATGAGDATTNVIVTASVTQAGAVTAAGTIRGHGLVSRAFFDSGDVYAAIVHPAFYFSYVAMVRLSAAAGAAAPNACRILCGQSPGLPSRNMVASVSALGLGATDYASRRHAVPLLYRIQLGADPTTNAASGNYGEVGIRLVSLDFSNASAWQTAQLGRGLYLGSACIQHYDGARWAEADFHCAPDTAAGGLAAPLVSETGGVIPPGTYNYIACYEEIDAQGELHQGACTVPLTVQIVTTNKKVALSIPTYRLTSKRKVRIGVYRSPAGQTGAPDQIPYYRVSSLDATAVGDNGYVTNDVTVDTVTFSDNMTDATLTTREPLYTNGGIRSNDPVESAGGAIVAGKNRLFWLDPHDPNVVHFSQELRDDTAAELVASLTLRLDPYGGDAVGLAVMDGGLFVLKDTAVYVVDGPGPLANPDAGSDAFSPAQLVTSDVGCKAPRSIAQTPIGIAFQSDKGIKLMGRDRQVQDLGSAVYAFNDQTVSRATLLPDRHQIVFLTASGSTLLYDYERGQWSRYTNHEGVDAVVWNGTYCYLRNDGRVFVETPGVYKDDNSHIPMVIETAWVKFGAGYLQGWQKVLRAAVIGAYKSSHQLQIRYRINYQEAYTTLAPINVDSVYAPSLYGAGLYGAGAYGGTIGSDTVYQQQVHLNVRCQSISFQFSDIESTSTFGAAFELSELLLIGGMIGTRFPMGASRSQ